MMEKLKAKGSEQLTYGIDSLCGIQRNYLLQLIKNVTIPNEKKLNILIKIYSEDKPYYIMDFKGVASVQKLYLYLREVVENKLILGVNAYPKFYKQLGGEQMKSGIRQMLGWAIQKNPKLILNVGGR